MKSLGFKNLINNRGVIFNHLPELILFLSKQNKSEATVIEKIANLANEEKSGAKIRRENNHYLNQLTNGNISEKTWNKVFGDNIEFSKIDDAFALNELNNTGGWGFLKAVIIGFSAEDTNPKTFLNFLLALCDVDKKIIEDRKNIQEINALVQTWLKLPEIDLEDTNKETGAKLVIALVLHITALFEHYLFNEFKNLENKSRMINCLPEQLNNKMIYSNEQFLIRFRKRWANHKYDKNDIKWADLYRDIVKARSPDSLENQIDPYTDAIKTTFYEWRNGKRFFTIETLKKELLVLYEDKSEYFDISLNIIIFIQLFDNIQRELIKQGTSENYIIKEFSKYPDYLKLVNDRFEKFKLDGSVLP